MTRLTDEELLTDIERVGDGLDADERLTAQVYRDRGDHSLTAIRNHFGSWNAAVEAAGREPTSPSRPIPEPELIAELRRLADAMDNTPTAAQMDAEGTYSPRPYLDRFGSWNAAIEAAGLEARSKRGVQAGAPRIDREALLAELRDLGDRVEGRPTMAEMDDRGAYAARTYQARFGSWNAALEAAGFEPRS